jgi:hypothetical protein
MSGIKQMSIALWLEGIGLSFPERQQLVRQQAGMLKPL